MLTHIEEYPSPHIGRLCYGCRPDGFDVCNGCLLEQHTMHEEQPRFLSLEAYLSRIENSTTTGFARLETMLGNLDNRFSAELATLNGRVGQLEAHELRNEDQLVRGEGAIEELVDLRRQVDAHIAAPWHIVTASRIDAVERDMHAIVITLGQVERTLQAEITADQRLTDSRRWAWGVASGAVILLVSILGFELLKLLH